MDHALHERMTRDAAAVAEMTKQFGLTLDYTDASIAGLEAFVSQLVKMSEAQGKQDDRNFVGNVAVKCGAYLGEVLRWKHGGEWVDIVPGDEHKLNALKQTTVFIFPMYQVMARVMRGPEDANLVNAYQAWTRDLSDKPRLSIAMTQDETERVLRGAHPDLPSLEAQMSADAELAHHVVAVVRMTLVTAADKWGLWLDFSETSVHGVEHILAFLHDLAQRPATPDDPQPTPEQIQEASVVWGLYLGEVIRRQWGGTWDLVTDQGSKKPCIIVNGFQLFPRLQTYKRLVNGPADNVATFFQTARKTILDARR